MRRGDVDGAAFRLSDRHPLRHRLEAMVGGVADQVGQRVTNEFDQLPVEFGVGARNGKLDGLVELAAKFARQAREAAEQAIERLHPGAHHQILQIRQEAR